MKKQQKFRLLLSLAGVTLSSPAGILQLAMDLKKIVSRVKSIAEDELTVIIFIANSSLCFIH